MKILLLIPELGKGGAQRSLSKLAMALSEQHEVHVLTFHSNYEQTYELPVAPQSLGQLQSSTLAKLTEWRRRLKRLKTFKQEHKIDVSISFLEGANYLNALSGKGHKTILSVRGSKQFDHKISGFSGWIRKKILIPRWFNKANKIVCVSDGIADEMAHFFKIRKDKLSVVKNFYNVKQIQADAAQKVDAQYEDVFSKTCIVFSGRLDIQKEPLGLLNAFALLKKERDVRLLMLGDGVLSESIKSKSQILGLTCGVEPNNDVVLLGYQTNPFAFISTGQLFVLSSSWEGFPNALAEAILCETPVISTDCPTGPREILEADIKGFDTIRKPLSTKKGTLMPLLNTGNSEVYALWAREMAASLDRDTSEEVGQAFKYISTFTHDRIMSQWENEIAS